MKNEADHLGIWNSDQTVAGAIRDSMDRYFLSFLFCFKFYSTFLTVSGKKGGNSPSWWRSALAAAASVGMGMQAGRQAEDWPIVFNPTTRLSLLERGRESSYPLPLSSFCCFVSSAVCSAIYPSPKTLDCVALLRRFHQWTTPRSYMVEGHMHERRRPKWPFVLDCPFSRSWGPRAINDHAH